MSRHEVATCCDICRYSRAVKSDADRGAFASWLRAQRKAARPDAPNGWKEAEAVRRLEAAKPGVSFGAYRDIEAGNRKPTTDQRDAIEAVFGRIPDFTGAGSGSGHNQPDPADLSRLFQLLEAQTLAFSRLAAAIERMVAQPLVVPPEVALAMRQAVAELEPPAPGTSSPPRSPDPLPSEGTPHRENPGTGSTAPRLSGTPRP